MKRTSVVLPDDVDARLRLAARQRGVPVTLMVREAIEEYIPASRTVGALPFFGIGESHTADSSENVDEIVSRAVEKEYEASRGC